VSNYETVLRIECEGHTCDVQLQLVLIVVVQRCGEIGGESKDSWL
jgi:hypothetical protein